MNWPPFLLKIVIRNQRHNFALWLPLFLIGPIFLAFLLAVFLIMLPFALLALIFTWHPGWLRMAVLGPAYILRVTCYLRGLTVDVDGRDGRVAIVFV